MCFSSFILNYNFVYSWLNCIYLTVNISYHFNREILKQHVTKIVNYVSWWSISAFHSQFKPSLSERACDSSLPSISRCSLEKEVRDGGQQGKTRHPAGWASLQKVPPKYLYFNLQPRPTQPLININNIPKRNMTDSHLKIMTKRYACLCANIWASGRWDHHDYNERVIFVCLFGFLSACWGGTHTHVSGTLHTRDLTPGSRRAANKDSITWLFK